MTSQTLYSYVCTNVTNMDAQYINVYVFMYFQYAKYPHINVVEKF